MKRTLVLLLSVVMVFVLAACGSDDGGDSKSEESSKVVIAGSTSVQPLSEMLAEKFMEENEDITVEVQGGGSGQGVKSVEEGIADLGALSREVKEGESVSEQFVIAKDGIAVVVNTDTDVTSLTMEQLKGIFTGEITNWKDVGGADAEIVVVSREEGSGTRAAFTELTGVTEDDVDNTVDSALVQGSTGAVQETVSNTADSIGYISLDALDTSAVKAINVEDVEATVDNILAGTYPLSRPFIYVSGDELTSAAQKWIDFVLSEEGQAIVEEQGFIPIA